MIVAVDRITPSRVQPLEDVRQELTLAWIARERTRRLRELGEDMQNDVRSGQSFAAAARANGFRVVVPSQSIDRRAAGQIPARGLAAQIFGSREGDVVGDMRADGGAVLVAQVEAINRVDPSENPQAVEAGRMQMQQSLVQSMATTVQAEVVARANVRRNEALISRLFPRGGDSEEAQ